MVRSSSLLRTAYRHHCALLTGCVLRTHTFIGLVVAGEPAVTTVASRAAVPRFLRLVASGPLTAEEPSAAVPASRAGGRAPRPLRSARWRAAAGLDNLRVAA